MNKYIVLSAATLVISLAVGCQNCGYKTAHSSRYETLVGTTRLASPQTNCRYNVCNVSNVCNPCNPCGTQALANNGQFCSNSYVQSGCQTGWTQQYAGQNESVSSSLLDATQSETAQSEAPLRWRSVTEEEQQYANSSVNTTSAGIASALGNPAFGSPAPASIVDPNYNAAAGVDQALRRRPGYGPGSVPPYPPRYPNSSPRVAMGVNSALTPGRPMPGTASQYDGYNPNTSPRAARGVDSALSVPNHPLPPQYSNQYPGYASRTPQGMGSEYGAYPAQGAGTQYPGQYSNQYPDQYYNQYSNAQAGYDSQMNGPSYGAQGAASDSDSLRWRRVTEEEQQYYNNSSRSAAPGAGYDNQQPLTVPVYQGNNAETPQTPNNANATENTKAPEIDPNALPMPETPVGTF